MIEDAGGLRIGLRDGLAQLRLLLENLPAELIYEYPRLKLARSLLLSKEGRLAEARRHLNEVESELKEDDPALRSDILLMDVMLGIYEGAEFSEADVAAMEALAREIPEAENFVRGWLNNLLCIMQFHRGHLVNARSAAQTAMVHYTDLGAVYLQIFIHLHLGVIAMEEGELSEAHMEHQKASILAQSHFASDKGLIGLARVPLAEVYYEWNDLERARGLVFDALAEADRENPAMIADFATLTGAARVSVGTELSALFCNDDTLANDLARSGDKVGDPVWRLPLWQPYRRLLDSEVADINNVSTGGMAGAITAALYLEEFVSRSTPWAHFDIMGWNTSNRSGRPIGGEAMGMRALYAVIEDRFGRRKKKAG